MRLEGGEGVERGEGLGGGEGGEGGESKREKRGERMDEGASGQHDKSDANFVKSGGWAQRRLNKETLLNESLERLDQNRSTCCTGN